jgi:hypothetical protein
MVYVVILHLSPDFDSKLTEVLQTVSKIPVAQVTSRVRVKPDHVYVVPPNQHLTMMDGEIAVTPNMAIEDRRAPVDIFFRTLAEIYGPRAVAVILSGTGANGSMGLKRVKEFGGAAFVQNPREAEFNEMGRNAIATGLVDEVLPVAQIPRQAWRKCWLQPTRKSGRKIRNRVCAKCSRSSAFIRGMTSQITNVLRCIEGSKGGSMCVTFLTLQHTLRCYVKILVKPPPC